MLEEEPLLGASSVGTDSRQNLNDGGRSTGKLARATSIKYWGNLVFLLPNLSLHFVIVFSYTMAVFTGLRLPAATHGGEFQRSPAEKSLVRRLDIFLMTFGCISQGKYWTGSEAVRLVLTKSGSYQVSCKFVHWTEIEYSQFPRYLDQSNISNAYVSGMKEDLNLVGNELN